jgi:hypothetical protein
MEVMRSHRTEKALDVKRHSSIIMHGGALEWVRLGGMQFATFPVCAGKARQRWVLRSEPGLIPCNANSSAISRDRTAAILKEVTGGWV